MSPSRRRPGSEFRNIARLEQTTQTCIARVMSNSDLARPRPIECTGNWTSRTHKSSYRAKLAEVEAAIACRTLEEMTGSDGRRAACQPL